LSDFLKSKPKTFIYLANLSRLIDDRGKRSKITVLSISHAFAMTAVDFLSRQTR